MMPHELTEAEREAIWAGLRRARHEEAPVPLAHEFHKTHVLWAVGPAVERIIAARLAQIRALVDEWEIGGTILVRNCHSRRDVFEGETQQRVAAAVRAALDAPVSASQDHDGSEGQGEGYCPACGAEVRCSLCGEELPQ